MTRIKIITEQADVDKSQIELKNGNFNGKRLPSPSYNSNAEVQTTEQIEFKSACDFGTSNTNIINYAGNLANDYLALFNNSVSSVATNSNIKTTLYLTSTPTTDQLNTINAKLASPGSNELVIWANFDTTTKKWTIKGLSSGSGDLKNKDGRNVTPFVKALDKILPDLSGFSASFNPITAILDGLSDLIGNASVAEKYYNPAATDYNPIPVKVYELISSPTLTNKINDVLKNNNGFNSPTEKYSDAAVQFAFTCGVWNGLVGTVQAVPAGTSMLVKAPGGILDLIMNTDGSRDKLTNFASNFDWDTAEILAKQLGGVLGAGWTKYTSNPCMISYSSGQAGFVIISCAIGAGEAKAASTFFETIEKLDVAGQLMSKALKYGGKGVALMLKVPTKSVKFALSEGFALAKGLEIRPSEKLFCDFAFPKIKINQLTEDVASLSTKVEEAINAEGGLGKLPLDENGNRLAKIIVDGEETPILLGTEDGLSKVDWEKLPETGDAADLVGRIFPMYPKVGFREMANQWTGELKQRFDLADNFYKNIGASNYDNELRGINFDKPVSSISKNKGSVMYQIVTLTDSKTPNYGSYFFEDEFEDITKLGIGDLNKIKADERVKIRIILSDEVEFLKSKTTNIEDWNDNSNLIFEGDGNQFFNSTAKKKIESFEIIEYY